MQDRTPGAAESQGVNCGHNAPGEDSRDLHSWERIYKVRGLEDGAGSSEDGETADGI